MADIDHTGTPGDIGGNFQILHFSHILHFLFSPWLLLFR
nr:MAG TPA_asm: hypothetical protein [Caudoviricetes sp.]